MIRRLIYAPVVHTQLDMGSLAGNMKHAYVQAYGTAQWSQHEKVIADFWQGLSRKVESLEVNPSGLRIYQDGLPVCGRELQIVTELAEKGSLNHKLVLRLVQKGAHLQGTEDAEALIEEYQLVKETLQILDLNERNCFIRKSARKSAELLTRRDEFIAHRINETLKPGEVGILFIGIIHNVPRYLPKDIQIQYLIYRLPFRRFEK